MRLAINNNLANLAVTSDASASDINSVLDYTFVDKYISGGSASDFVLSGSAGEYTYIAIAGHNLGSTGATITIVNHGVIDVAAYTPIDDRVLFFDVPARTGGSDDVVIQINKAQSSDKIVINHLAAGLYTDMSAPAGLGQTVQSDYEANYPLTSMYLSRKIKTQSSDIGAPTATLTKTTTPKVMLKFSNVPRNFAKTELVEYQRFWSQTGFFIQHDNSPDQSALAFEFIPGDVRAHGTTRELVTLSYAFRGYAGL